jgi:hypothetical protein
MMIENEQYTGADSFGYYAWLYMKKGIIKIHGNLAAEYGTIILQPSLSLAARLYEFIERIQLEYLTKIECNPMLVDVTNNDKVNEYNARRKRNLIMIEYIRFIKDKVKLANKFLNTGIATYRELTQYIYCCGQAAASNARVVEVYYNILKALDLSPADKEKLMFILNEIAAMDVIPFDLYDETFTPVKLEQLNRHIKYMNIVLNHALTAGSKNLR